MALLPIMHLCKLQGYAPPRARSPPAVMHMLRNIISSVILAEL